LQELCNSFSELFSVAVAILELDGEILISSGFKDACKNFHRIHPTTAARCVESDTALASAMQEGQSYNCYRCKNGLVDVATPIRIEGRHVANLFMGQFFIEKEDPNVFFRQAMDIGFDTTSYMAAINNIPVFTEEKVKVMAECRCRIAEVISEIGYGNSLLSEANKKLDAKSAKLEIALHRVAESEREMRLILDNVAAGVFLKALDGRYLFANSYLCRTLDVKLESIRGNQAKDLNIPLLNQLSNSDSQVLAGEDVFIEELTVAGLTFCVKLVTIADSSGNPTALCGVLLDITKQKQQEFDLRRSHKLLNTVIENIPSIVFLKSIEDGKYHLMNAFAESALGIPREEVMRDLTNREAKIIDHPLLSTIAALPTPEDHGSVFERDLTFGGRSRSYLCKRVDVKNEAGEAELALFVADDITDKRAAEAQLKHQALHDTLTGLPNRNLLDIYLQRQIDELIRTEKRLAYFFIDLDHFKFVNDTAGHDVGDQIVAEAAKRIARCVRKHDMVCRFGGDEFIVVVSGFNECSVPDQIALEINRSVAKPYLVQGQSYYLTASIGIALYPDDAKNHIDLLKCADQAMYHSKNSGRGCFHYFAASMQANAVHRLNIANDLCRAIGNGELEFYYQPIVNLKNNTINKAEALLRWNHPSGQLIYPDVFIPIAEQAGSIHELGSWCFNSAIDQSLSWSKQLGPDFQISVNKSPVQFRKSNADDIWLKKLSKAGMNGCNLAIEITEGVLMNQDLSVVNSLKRYREHGIGNSDLRTRNAIISRTRI